MEKIIINNEKDLNWKMNHIIFFFGLVNCVNERADDRAMNGIVKMRDKEIAKPQMN